VTGDFGGGIPITIFPVTVAVLTALLILVVYWAGRRVTPLIETQIDNVRTAQCQADAFGTAALPTAAAYSPENRSDVLIDTVVRIR